jgi:hypothetical protein
VLKEKELVALRRHAVGPDTRSALLSQLFSKGVGNMSVLPRTVALPALLMLPLLPPPPLLVSKVGIVHPVRATEPGTLLLPFASFVKLLLPLLLL